MSKIGTLLKVGALTCALAVTGIANADSIFKVPVNYSVKVVDGQNSDFNYNRFSREITLTPGRHQIVLLFEGNFGAARDSKLIQAANPIVIDIYDMPDQQVYTFDYKLPTSDYEAENFSRTQNITLINQETKAPLSNKDASYFILTSDSGFAILRDYRDDLASVGRLYAPTPVLEAMKNGSDRTTVNAAGVQTVRARASNSVFIGHNENQTPVASNTPPQVKASSKGTAGKVAPDVVNYEQLVQLYEAADDNTKLKFVKYIMTH